MADEAACRFWARRRLSPPMVVAASRTLPREVVRVDIFVRVPLSASSWCSLMMGLDKADPKVLGGIR